MAEEWTVGDIRKQVDARLGRVEDDVRGLRDEMHRHFDQAERLAVAILLVEVIGFGSLWLK